MFPNKATKRRRDDDILDAVHYNDLEDSIYLIGDTEIHFTANVNDRHIERLKRLIAQVVQDSKKKLKPISDGDDFDDASTTERDFFITYVVNSPGGSVSSVLGLVDYIRVLKSKYKNLKFHSIATGCVASAGTIMCVVADKKTITKNTFAMIHELSGSPGFTNYTKLQSHAEYTKKLHDVMVNIYLTNTGKDPSDKNEVAELERKLLRESWLSSEEYKEQGFVDEII
jgi:ATP-dependent protease ClpP protease subunit